MESGIRKRQRAWLVGLGMALTLWVFLGFFADIHFSTNDDQFIMRTFAGSGPEGAPGFHLFVLGLYAYPLRWLNRLFPNIAWFSLLEIGLMGLSTTVIVKSIILRFEQHSARNGFWKGFVASLSFVLLFLFYLCARPTFTTVAASLGAASVAQLMSIDWMQRSRGRMLFSVVSSLFLLILTISLREKTLLPTLSFWFLVLIHQAFVCHGAENDKKRYIKPLCVFLAAMLLAGGLVIARELEIDLCKQRQIIHWNETRSSVQDFLLMENISEETREAVEWSDTQVSLLNEWYTMDETLSIEAFAYVYQHENTAQNRPSAGAAIWNFRMGSPLIALSLILLFLIGCGCLLGLTLRRKGLWTFLALVASAVGCMLMLAYLAIEGRLPFRAVMVPVLPAAAFVFCLMPECLPDKRWFVTAFYALMIACTAVYIIPTAREVQYHQSPWDYNTHAAMDEIALEHPDLLFIYSNELVNDLRLFPDFSNGVPTNLMFWGGWQRGSPEYNARMKSFGLDGDHFTPQDWLNPQLRYLTLEQEPHPLLVQHLREKLGEQLRWEQTKMDIALYAYRFYLE